MSASPSLTTQAGRFIDPQGRQVILHGINLVNKDPKTGYLGSEDIKTFASFRRWGLNCVRLGVMWDGLEPEPGLYNEAYLEGIDQRIAWAKANDLYVFLDMHQDLYSVLYADGAPRWATLAEGQPHMPLGKVWSDAYFTSPAVQTALDNFWKNSAAPDGMGLQEHYAKTWAMLAQRYAGEPAVIGYDLMNEPFPGSAATASQTLMFKRGAELLAQIDGAEAPSAEVLAAQWFEPDGRFQILQRTKDANLYAQIIDVAQPIYTAFEQGALKGLYQRLMEAIRAVDNGSILFLESSMGSNMGVYSGIEPLASGGQRDPQQAYAPHGYDLTVYAFWNASASTERVKLIFSRHADTARRGGWPMLVGEWGAYGLLPGALPAAREMMRVFEQLLCSDTYWVYEPKIETAACFPALWRPYPERVAGKLKSYHYDPDSWSFECTWVEDPGLTASSIIFLPGWLGFDGTDHDSRKPVLTPAGEYQIAAHAGGTWLHIPPTGHAVQRTLKI